MCAHADPFHPQIGTEALLFSDLPQKTCNIPRFFVCCYYGKIRSKGSCTVNSRLTEKKNSTKSSFFVKKELFSFGYCGATRLTTKYTILSMRVFSAFSFGHIFLQFSLRDSGRWRRAFRTARRLRLPAMRLFSSNRSIPCSCTAGVFRACRI